MIIFKILMASVIYTRLINYRCNILQAKLVG